MKNPFTVNTDDSEKKLGDFFIQHNDPIEFLSILFSKEQRNYTTTDKDLLG